MTEFNNQAQKGKRDPKFLDQIVNLMQNVVDYLPNLIGRQWQKKAIYDIMCNFLYKENKLELRLRGLEIYTKFLLALSPAESEYEENKDILALFGQSLLFQPFGGPGVAFALYPLEAPNSVAVWQPGGTTSESDGEALLRKALELITKEQGSRFEFAIELVKRNVFSTMYPKVFQQMGLLPKDQNTGFAECPPKLQRLVVSYLDSWMKESSKLKVLWGNARNAQLMLEIYAQGMAVSVSDCDLSSSVMRTFGSVFFTDSAVPEVSSRLTDYCVFYLKKWVGVFAKPSEGNIPNHAKLCRVAIKVLLTKIGVYYSRVDEQVQGLILAVSINAISSACSNSALFHEIGGEVTAAGLKIWLMTQTDKTWKPIQKAITAAFNVSPKAIDAVQEVFIQLTMIVRKFYYPCKEVKESKRQLGAAGQQTAGHISRSSDFRPLKDPPEPDMVLLNAVPWDTKSSLQSWTNVKGIFSDLSAVRDVSNFAKSIEALVYIVDFLIQVEGAVPFEALANTQNRPLLLIDVFGPLLCEIIMQSGGEILIPGKSIAFGALCRILCRQTDSVPEVILEYVYSVLARELESNPLSPTTYEIIGNCGAIFSLALPGAQKLIPYFLAAIKTIAEFSKNDVPDNCWRNSVAIVSSLICFPDHFKDLNIAVDAKKLSPKLNNIKSLHGQELKDLVSELLIKLIGRVSKPEHAVNVLCGLTVFIMNECRVSSSMASKKLVSEFVSAIIQRCSSDNTEVCRGALQCMATLAMDCSTLEAFDPGLLHLSVQGVANAITARLLASSGTPGSLQVASVITSFETLEEWTLSVPSNVIQHHTVSRSVFAAIEMGLLGQQLQPSAFAEDKTRKGKKSVPEVKSFATLRSNPAHGSKEVAEVAEVLLRSMLNLHCHWPGPGGPELTGTMVRETGETENDENSESNVYYFANGSIVTLVPPAGDQPKSQVRVLVRDEADRYAWDAEAQFDDGSNKKSLPLPQDGLIIEEPSKHHQTQRAFRREFKEPPTWKPEENSKGVDKVDELLKYLGESYDDCKYQSDTIEIASEIKHLAEETARLMDSQQTEIDKATTEGRKSSLNSGNDGEPFDSAKDSNHWTRLFLSHFNFVDYDQRQWFAMLESGTPMQRSINTLDTKRAREAFKIGVIYVKNGQDTQENILRNETRSQYFDAFMRALAWEVNMGTHKGYVGGLDTTKFLTGTSAPYYSTSRLECMFHDITCMPTDYKDEQQIHKKRHVGNDVVNIVFSEHTRDYDPSTISTQFNCAHIICYPLPNGLYRIQICRKEEQVYPLFGPLVHNTCITGRLLPLLVRQTALNANRNFTSHKAGYLMPCPNRAKDVSQLLQRYKENNEDYTKTVLCSFKKQ